MEREGLGRGIEDISRLFLSRRPKPPDEAAPAPERAAPDHRPAEVWPVVRVGQPLPAETSWQMAWRLAPLGSHTVHVAVGPAETQVRWLGQALQPPAVESPEALLEAADAAVIDLTLASAAVRDRVALAAGHLVVVTGTTEADTLACYAFIKAIREHMNGLALGLEVSGPRPEADAARSRLHDAVAHFLKRSLVDWRERNPLPAAAFSGSGPEPPLAAVWPSDRAINAVCALASRHEIPPAPAPRVVSATARAGTNPPERDARRALIHPLVVWPDPDLDQLADFVERNPHLVQADLNLVGRGLHPPGEGIADLLGVDRAGRMAVVLVGLAGEAAMLLVGIAYLRWCVTEAPLLSRLDDRLRPEPGLPPQLILAACRFDSAVLEAARTIGRPGISLVELRGYELAGDHAVAVARVA